MTHLNTLPSAFFPIAAAASLAAVARWTAIVWSRFGPWRTGAALPTTGGVLTALSDAPEPTAAFVGLAESAAKPGTPSVTIIRSVREAVAIVPQ